MLVMLSAHKHRLELLVSLGTMLLLAYVAWQVYYGPRSFGHRDVLSLRLAQAQADLAAVSNVRAAMDERVQLMRPESVDADMLDQLARANLNMAKGNDVMVLIQR